MTKDELKPPLLNYTLYPPGRSDPPEGTGGAEFAGFAFRF